MTRSRYAPEDLSIARSRELRRNATSAEKHLWSALRNRQLGGYKFRRQQRLGPYIVDFACQEQRLVIEVDGDTHALTRAYDAKRTAFLTQEGYRVVRFTNNDVLHNREGVLTELMLELCRAPSPSHSPTASGPRPLPHGEREI